MFTQIKGSAKLRSVLSLEEIADILSQKLFGGVRFSGKDVKLYDDVPAVFISQLCGLKVILYGGLKDGHDRLYFLSFQPLIFPTEVDREYFSLNNYLEEVLRIVLRDHSNIAVEKYEGVS